MQHDFRKPVFVRNDEVSQLEASVVVWDARMDIVPTIKFTNGNSESVLIDAADWDRIKAAIDLELGRVV